VRNGAQALTVHAGFASLTGHAGFAFLLVFGVTAGSIAGNAANGACLSKSAIPIPFPVPGQQLNIHLRENDVADGQGMELHANMPKYPLVVRSAPGKNCVRNLRVVGQQSRSLTWREMKESYDGDAILFKRYTGALTVEHVWLDNVMDGISPRSTDNTSPWIVRGVYARNVRDDFIENDQCLPGIVDDVLVDGTFTFVSTRPGKRQPCPAANTTVVRRSLVRLQCQPHADRATEAKYPSCDAGTGHGQLWKWSTAAGPVAVTDSIFVVPTHSVNGPKAMGFPRGTYTNVALVWLGLGPYPGELPAGVHVIHDESHWHAARTHWLVRHGCDARGDRCRFAAQREQ
jgi:hypothetical protein